MKTFLSKIPQAVPFDNILGFDASLESAIRDVAQSHGMPASNGQSDILEAFAGVELAQLIHDAEDRDAFRKGLVKGLLIGASLSKVCSEYVNLTKKEGTPQ